MDSEQEWLCFNSGKQHKVHVYIKTKTSFPEMQSAYLLLFKSQEHKITFFHLLLWALIERYFYFLVLSQKQGKIP